MMIENIKLSVCITAYNHEKYIAKAIDGVLMQKVAFDYEILIGEDDSTDNTRAIVKKYKKEFPGKIRLFLNDRQNVIYINGQASGMWNFQNLLLNANGEYVALLDGDDYWTDPLKLQKQVDFLDSNSDCSTIFHWADRLENNEIRPKAFGPQEIKFRYNVDDLLRHSNFIPTCSAIFRSSLIKKFPDWFFNCPYGDLPIHIMNALKGDIGFIDESMAVRRVHAGGMYSGKSSINKQLNNLYAFELIAANLALTDRDSYQHYTDDRVRDIMLLIKDDAVIREAEQLIDSFDSIPDSFYKLQALKADIKDKTSKTCLVDTLEIPVLTVIVCTYNRSDLLPDCLDSLCRQTAAKNLYSIIIVDNNSSDDTKRVAEEFAAKMSNIKVVKELKQGLSHARNSGLKEAITRYVAYIDDDARTPENWVEDALKIIEEHDPDIFGGPATPLFAGDVPPWFKERYGIRGDMGETGWIHKGHIVGTNIFFKKAFLEECGGFDPELGMKGDNVGYHEETALVHRAFAEGRKVYYAKELLVKDRVPDYKLSLAYFFYSKYKAGYDGTKLWGGASIESLPNLPDLIDNTMNSFDYALRKRDSEKYFYPENYIIEVLAPLFIDLGKKVKCCKDNDLLENASSGYSNECMSKELQRLVEKNGCWKTAKALITHIMKRTHNVSRHNNNNNAA